MINEQEWPPGKANHRFIPLPLQIFSAVFIFFGFAALVWLIISIVQNPGIQLALNSASSDTAQSPSFVIAFLIEFGFVLPILTLSLSAVFITLGFKIRSGDITYAHWARIALIWLAVGIGFAFLFNIIQLLSPYLFPDPQKTAELDQGRIILLLVILLILALVIFCILWLRRNFSRYFQGKEMLMSSEVRFAWNLLIPTLAIFVLVAARPLEQTFIRSLTDKRFAGQEVPNFVGLDNYMNLLGVRLDTVDCRLNEDSKTCATSPNGSIVWESIGRDYLKEGFRTVWTIKIPFSEKPTALAISGLDKDFIRAIGTTLIFAIISVSLELSIAMFMALTVNSEFKGRGLMRAVMLIPWAIPTVISAKLWDLMLKDTSAGIINRVLMDLNLVDAPQAWLSVPSLQMPSAIMVDVWKTSPFMALLLLAGLQTIPDDLYEAASVDGASRIQQFFSITLPILKPTIAVALVFRTLDALRVFDLFNVLFGRQQLSMATYNYEMLVNSQRDGYSSAVSIIIFLLISIFAIIYIRLLNVEKNQ